MKSDTLLPAPARQVPRLRKSVPMATIAIKIPESELSVIRWAASQCADLSAEAYIERMVANKAKVIRISR